MSERHAIQSGFSDIRGNYWGNRIYSQLMYLEEINKISDGKYERLLDTVTEKAAGITTAEGTMTKTGAAEIEQLFFEAQDDAKSIKVSCVGHAHIDMNWQWRYDETVSITIDTFRTMLNLMKEYPDFIFAQSQASVYRIIEEYAPEMLPEIIDRIKEGRWEVTASAWVETDKNMPNGESLTRHILYTRQYLKKLLGLSDEQFLIDFEPDTFGHNQNVPEILRSGGVKYYYHCRGYEGHNLYKWRSPSGAEITVFRDPTWYLGGVDAETFLYVPDFCHKNGTNRMLHVYGVGDHGGGATRRDIENILDMAGWPCMPELKFGRYDDFFHYIENLNLPIVEGELNFVFNGCYTTQTRIKKANRASEAALYESEAFNAISGIYGGYPYSPAAYAGAWEKVLFSHFHDILPGSGVIDTREHALGSFQEAMAVAGVRKSASLRSITELIGTSAMLPANEICRDSRAEGAGVGFGVYGFNYTEANFTGGKKRLFIIFNPSQAEQHGCAAITVWDWNGDISKVKVTDETGSPMEIQLIDHERQPYWGHSYFRLLVFCEAEAFGYRTVLLEESSSLSPLILPKDPRRDHVQSLVLENEHVKAVFDSQTAALISFTDKHSGKEHIDGSGNGGTFRYIAEDDPGMSAWSVGRYAYLEPVVQGVRLVSGVSGSLRRSFTFDVRIKDSTLKATVSLDKGSRMLKYDVECIWREFGAAHEWIPQLGFYLPLSGHREKYIQDIALGVIERAGMDYDVPASSFSFAAAESGGLMLASDSKYGFCCTDDSMALTLIRSACDPDPAPECYTHKFTIGVGIQTDTSAKTLIESSLRFNHPLIPVAASSHNGDLPLSGSFVSLEEGTAVISAVKAAEADPTQMIVRLYEVSGSDGECVLKFAKAPKAAVYIDAHENELGLTAPKTDGGTVRMSLRGGAVTAVQLTF